jgi:LmbE family N-acetylglucosaminyl deacetylase
MFKFFISLLFILLFTNLKAQQTKTILAIVAHPDDETILGEVLLKYKTMGYNIKLIIATDGKDGTRVTTVPAGDSLGNLRKQESICACAKIGIEPPLFLGIDRLDTKHGTRQYFNSHDSLMQLLKEKIPAINPSFIITFGPDGDTHHAEHIVTGASVTELLLKEGWVDKYPLYYLAWSKQQNKINEIEELGVVDGQYLNVKILYTQEEENKALEMMPCYVTQFTAEEIKGDKEKKIADKTNAMYFRKFVVAKGMKNSF